jgi:hypothetical protein
MTSPTTTEAQQREATEKPEPLPPPLSPRRYIYNDTDVQHFLSSASKKHLYQFTVAMGKACATNTTRTTTSANTDTNHPNPNTVAPVYDYSYNHLQPLVGLSPGMACLHGALSIMNEEWVHHDFPISTTNTIGNRFGNPIFRLWHQQLQQRSPHIIATILQVSYEYSQGVQRRNQDDDNVNTSEVEDEEREYDMDVLVRAHEAGKMAARWGTTNTRTTTEESDTNPHIDDDLYHTFHEQDRQMVTELSYYFHDAFGQPIRLDYGTGHETSFHIFLFLLCQLQVFQNRGYKIHRDGLSSEQNTATQSPYSETNHDTATTDTISPPVGAVLPSIRRCKATIISIYHQYLQVTRTLQTKYMLEPAGSHGVWGLDDYHCLPFYFGACQLIPEQQQQQQQRRDDEKFVPSSIHNDQILQQYGDTYLYYGCIRFIKSIKTNVPFFESSPMLNDISHIATWFKIASGLIKLYDGEVLSKLPVVQHLVFGTLFPAHWVPSQNMDNSQPPTETFRNTTTTTTTTTSTAVPSSRNSSVTTPIVETRAPWAK